MGGTSSGAPQAGVVDPLPPPPPRPPTRELVIDQEDEKLEIVWRGEIPTVHVPRRDIDRSTKRRVATSRTSRLQELQLVRGDPAHDFP